MEKLNIVFMGTPDFALKALQSLYDAGHNILAVYCQPPRPKGRGQILQKNPTHIWAEEHHIPVLTPLNFKNTADIDIFKSFNPDIAVVAAYGLLLPKEILEIPKMGCVNIHGSLLPRWRGAAPIQRAIMAGDQETGITTMLMDEGLDTGDILEMEKVYILDETTTQSLYEELSNLGAELILSTIQGLYNNTIQPISQPEKGVTYAPKLEKQEGELDFSQPAIDLYYTIKGLNPQVSVWIQHNDLQFKIIHVDVVDDGFDIAHGELILNNQDLLIQCGKGMLKILTVQPHSGKVMDIACFLRGYSEHF